MVAGELSELGAAGGIELELDFELTRLVG